jgi:hypothetical protein
LESLIKWVDKVVKEIMAMGWIFSEYDLKNEAMNYSANVLRR